MGTEEQIINILKDIIEHYKVEEEMGLDSQYRRALEQVIQLLKDKNNTICELNNFLLNNGLMFKSNK